MSISYPSKKVIVADLPEVRDFRAKFVYNFFVNTEKVNESSDVPDRFKIRAGESFDSAQIDLISRFLPRYVQFGFTPVIDQHEAGRANEFIAAVDNSLELNDRRRYSKEKIAALLRSRGIISEEELSNNLYTSFNFQDDNIDQKLTTFVSGTVAKRITAHNRLVQQGIEQNKGLLIDQLGSEHSLRTAAAALNQQISGDSDEGVDNPVVDALNSIENLKLQFIDEEKQRVIEDDTFSRVSDVSFKAQFNNKIVGQVFQNIINDPMNQFSDELKQVLSRARKREITSREPHNSNIISDEEYDTVLNTIDIIPVDATDHWSKSRVIGYVIEKYEIPKRGTTPIPRNPIIIPGPDISTAIDTEVRYGSTYIYVIRTLAEAEIKAIDDDGTAVLAVSLLSSQASKRVRVVCEERVPPPPPADFNVTWDYQRSLPILTWSIPVDTQRDIKRFQVFRRATVDEPFQLIKEYDFDDSVIRTVRVENPLQDLVERVDSPVTRFIDSEFKKGSRFIYALASIDAHDQSSGYSIQLEVSFDIFSNKLKKKFISPSDAPKSYPNMYLFADVFENTIRTSAHSRVRVYLDAEAIEIVDNNGDVKDAYVTLNNSPSNKYRLQLINVDLQKQDVLNIQVRDNRESKRSLIINEKYRVVSPSKERLLRTNRGTTLHSGFNKRAPK